MSKPLTRKELKANAARVAEIKANAARIIARVQASHRRAPPIAIKELRKLEAAYRAEMVSKGRTVVEWAEYEQNQPANGQAKRVVLDNGLVIHSTWYESQTRTRSGKLRGYEGYMAQTKKRHKEEMWLNAQSKKT